MGPIAQEARWDLETQGTARFVAAAHNPDCSPSEATTLLRASFSSIVPPSAVNGRFTDGERIICHQW